MSRPFIQWETEMAVWHADENGWPLGTLLWIGSCESKLEVTQSYAEEKAEVSGAGWPDYRLLEGEHLVSLENLWTLPEAAPDSGQLVMPAVTRGQRFVTVLIWTNADGFWIKRTYFNCQFNPFVFGSSQQYFDQRLTMKAGWMFEETGRTTVSTPALSASRIAFVRYVAPGETVTLYRHNLDTHLFTAVADTTGRAAIVPATAGGYDFSVAFNGTRRLGITAAGAVHAVSLTVTGGTFVASKTRVEFMVGPRRIASLGSDGELAYPFLRLTGSPGADAMQLRSSLGTVLATFDRSGLYATSAAADL